MKILLLGDISSSHIQNWANSLDDSGEEVGIFSFSSSDDILTYNSSVKILNNGKGLSESKGPFSKLKYLKLLPSLKGAINIFNPDILHAHYASSYGLLGALSGFHPYCISVWGSDVYEFPNTGAIAKEILKSNFKKADKIFSTSFAMLKEIEKYTNKEIEEIPFGVDINRFKKPEKDLDKKDIVIGTIKDLEEVYGIEVLLKAFEILAKRNPLLPLKLLIVGKGSLEAELKKLSVTLGISDKVEFPGYISPDHVADYHNMIDIFMCLSHAESFGVSVVEAMACSTPVVVSNVGGLPEVVIDKKTGIVVEPDDPDSAASAIEWLLNNVEEAEKIGQNGRLHVVEKYDADVCVQKMIDNYALL